MPPALFSTSAGSGPAVLLLHGQPGTSADFFRLVPLLARAGFRAIAVDRPGYGRTRGPALGFAGNAQRALALLDELGVGRVTVVGHSWGGAVALAMALAQPDRVAGMVLQGSVGGRGSVTPADRLLALPGLGPVALAVGLQAAALGLPRDRIRSRMAPELDGMPTHRVSRMAAVWGQARTARSAAVEQRALVRELPGLVAQLAAIAAPAVVVVGRSDRRVSVRSQADLAAQLPDARRIDVEGGHLLAVEDAEAVVSAVEQLHR